MMQPLANWLTKDFWIFEVWQIFPLLALIGLIIFWRSYRNRQM